MPWRLPVISVMVVDDSALVRRVVTDALAEDPEIEVVGTASNGKLALAKIEQLRPDIITLDIEMPEMDGLETLKELRRTRTRLPVIMFSTLTELGATATLNALALGASDYVTKPSNTGSFAQARKNVQEQLIPRIHALCRKPGVATRPGAAAPPVQPGTPAHAAARLAPPPPPPAPTGPPPPKADRIDVVVLGCSTGGPDALTKVVCGLPAAFPVPMVVVQHMPPVFTKMFAQRLDRAAPMRIVEATDGMTLEAGCLYLAPGDYHLELTRGRNSQIVTRLTQGPPENFCRPAVDVLFRSVTPVFGGRTLAVILTGMGHDGLAGCQLLRSKGAEIVVQDQATSVVWGMPGAVAEAGIADSILPLEKVASHVVGRAAQGRGAQSKVLSWR
jgi:two-component system chemotaxis response regulator CheB